MCNVLPEKKKLMYGKHTVVHESRYFIQARRAIASCYHVDLERGVVPRQLLPHANVLYQTDNDLQRLSSIRF